MFAAFGPERPVTSGDLVTVRGGIRGFPRIASSGNGYLVVWSDHRSGTASLYGARLSADGTLLDPTGFLIAQNAGSAEIVWTGQTYVAVWGFVDKMMSVTISPVGVVGTPKAALEVPKYMGIAAFGIATNGSTILVATSLGIGSLLEADGTLIGHMTLGPQTNLLNAGVGVASAGGEYLVAFGTSNGVVTQKVSSSGQPSAPLLHEGSQRGAFTAVASDGTNYLVVSAVRAITGQLVSRDNVPIGGMKTLANAYTVEGFEFPSVGPSAAWRGGEYLVTYGQKNDTELFAVRVGQDATPLAAPVKFAESSYNREARLVAIGGGTGAAVWIDRGSLVQVARFDNLSIAANTPLAGAKPINYSAAPQNLPALARVANQMIAAWSEARPEGSQLRVAALGGEPIVVATLVEPNFYRKIDVLFDGETVWVVWIDRGLFVRRYTPALEPIDATPLAFVLHEEADYGRPMGLAAGRAGIAIVFSSYADLIVTTLHVEGEAVVATHTVIPAPLVRCYNPAPIWDGERYAIAFAHDLSTTWWQFPEPIPNEVLVTHVSREGVVLDATPILIAREKDMNDIESLRATRGADGSMVIAWQTFQFSKTYLARFTGTEKPPVVILPSTLGLKLGAIAALPGGYEVFRHTRDAVQHERFDAALARVSEPEQLPVPHAYWWDPFYDVETLGGQLHFVYARATEDAYGGVPRLFWRVSDDTGRRRAAR